MSVKIICGHCNSEVKLPLGKPTLSQQVHDFLAAVNVAAPRELKDAARELEEMADNPGSSISMRPMYRKLSKLLEAETR